MFWWLIWAFIFIVVVGNDSEHWGGLWGNREGRMSGVWGRRRNRKQRDYDLKMHYMKASQSDVVVVTADDKIDFPDEYLEKLIEDGKLDEAREYRLDMERMADQMDDEASQRKYAIYGARIARKRKKMKIAAKKKQYYKKPSKKPVKKEPEVIKTDPIITPVSGDPFGSKKTKPPLWKSKSKPKVAEDAGPLAHLEFEPEPVPEVKPEVKPEPVHEPVKPVEKKPEMPDFSELPPGPIEVGGMPDYEPGPVKMDPSSEGITRQDDKIHDEEDYEGLIDI